MARKKSEENTEIGDELAVENEVIETPIVESEESMISEPTQGPTEYSVEPESLPEEEPTALANSGYREKNEKLLENKANEPEVTISIKPVKLTPSQIDNIHYHRWMKQSSDED